MRALLALLAMTLAQESLPIVLHTHGSGTPLPVHFIREALNTAAKQGREAWVITAHQISGIEAWSLDLYLAPVRPLAAVRRGTVVSILAGDHRGRRRWSIVRTATYAHVPVRFQHPYEVRNETDPARPFAVVGELSDQDILSVVELLRSRPRHRGERSERIVDVLPIVSLSRTGDGQIQASLGVDSDSGLDVMVQRLTDGWTVTSVLDRVR